MRPEAAFPYVFAAEGAQHPQKKSPRSTPHRNATNRNHAITRNNPINQNHAIVRNETERLEKRRSVKDGRNCQDYLS